MSVQHLSPTATAEEIAKVLAADGAVIVDDHADLGLLDRFDAEISPFISATATGPDDFSGHNTRRTGALLARAPSARSLVMDPLVLGTCDAVLGHATSYQLHLTQVISIGPNEPAQPIHRDCWAYDFFTFPAGYEVQANSPSADAEASPASAARADDGFASERVTPLAGTLR